MGHRVFLDESQMELFNILAPEIIFGKTIGDFVAVWKLQQKMEQYALDDNVEWGLSHGFLAMMGSFRVIVTVESPKPPSADALDDTRVQEEGNGRQDPDVRIEDGIRFQDLSPRRANCQHPANPDSGPNVEVDVQDVIDSYVLLGRNILSFRDLTVSQLELMTTAFSLCAVITYVFLLYKPRGIQCPQRPLSIKLNAPLRSDWIALQTMIIPTVSHQEVKLPPRARIPNDLSTLRPFNSIYSV
ncbi:hypothetical protein N431DRAFT_511630 [Stipitochalara longipes BDJ]|nr:hypothetical protein N431DRAFT_511630 [Stipitochalara longipes BDJ]